MCFIGSDWDQVQCTLHHLKALCHKLPSRERRSPHAGRASEGGQRVSSFNDLLMICLLWAPGDKCLYLEVKTEELSVHVVMARRLFIHNELPANFPPAVSHVTRELQRRYYVANKACRAWTMPFAGLHC